MEIRNAKKEELKEIIEIERICFPSREAASKEQFEERFQVFSENFFVAVIDDRVVGFINGACTNQAELPDELYHDASLHVIAGEYQTVFGLDVLPEYQHLGIGRKLLEYMIDISRKRGKKGVVLTCKDHLIGFYEKSGFICHGRSLSNHGGAIWNDMLLNIDRSE